MKLILSQILGGVALILVCISYFLKKKINFLILQIFADIFYAGAFFVVGANVAGVVTAISIVRNTTLFFKEKYDLKHIDYTVFIFIALYILFAILFWNGLLDIIPLISSILFALCFMIKDLQKMRGFFDNSKCNSFNLYYRKLSASSPKGYLTATDGYSNG